MKRTGIFLKNGLILAGCSIFMRAAGVSFNVYITNQVGAEGIGLYGLIMSVYMFATTLASSGVNLATTRLVTEELAKNNFYGIKKSMFCALFYSLTFGILSASLLFFFAPQIAEYWLRDLRTLRPLYALSVSLPFISLSAAMSGYFMAVRRIAKNAVTQIFELTIKILVTIYTLRLFAGRGIEHACFAMVLSGSIAEMCSCLLLYSLYRHDRLRYHASRGHGNGYLGRLVSVSMPVAVSAYLRSGLVTLEHLLVPIGLKKYGASSSSSLAQYGVIHGMVMPVLLFPSALVSAFASLLVPEFTELQTQQKKAGINRIASRAFSTALQFSIGTATIFFTFAESLGMALYKSADAGLFIKFLAPLCVVMYLDGVTDAMLKGLNEQMSSMRYNIIDSAVSVVLIYTLLPRYGVDGYIAVLFITELLNAFLSMNRLICVTDFSFSLKKDILRPLLAACLASVLVRQFANFFFSGIASTSLSLAAAVIFVFVIYTALLYLSKNICD